MIRKVGIMVGVVCGLAAMSGCSSPRHTKIADLDPYVGPYPSKPIALAPRVQRTPRVAKYRAPVRWSAPGSGRGGWVPQGGIMKRWDCIVIHHSGSDKSTPAGMRDWHVNGRGWDALGYHFVIGNGIGYGDGEIYVGERWHKQMHGAHCKTPCNHYNDHGIGICLIGDFQTHAPTRKQVDALAQLASFLCCRCGIPTSQVLTHGGVTHKTACPGRCFALSPVLKRMSSGSVTASSR